MVTVQKSSGKDKNLANFLNLARQIEGAAKIVSEGGTEGGVVLKDRYIGDSSSSNSSSTSGSSSHSRPSGARINLDKHSTSGGLKIRKKPSL